MSSLSSCEKGVVSAALGEKKDYNENKTKDPRTQQGNAHFKQDRILPSVSSLPSLCCGHNDTILKP